MEEDLPSNSLTLSSNVENSEEVNFSEIKLKILNKEYEICNKKGRSTVGQIFGKVKTSTGDELNNIVACRTCWNVYKFNQNSTSNLVRHKCYKNFKDSVSVSKIEVSADLKHVGINILTEWVIANCRPFQIVKDSGLLKFSEFLVSIGAKYGLHVNVEALLPHPTTISRNVSTLYDKTLAKVKNDLQFVTGNKIGFGLTSDIWTDNYIRTSYVSLTIHYTKDGELINRLLGLSAFEGQRCTGENIQRKVLNILKFHDLLIDKSVFVTDRGSNMKKAFEPFKRISCINHLMNNVLEQAKTSIPELNELCDAATKLVKFFKKSGENSGLQTTLKSFSPSRWNSIFYLLSSVKKNWAEITDILQAKQQLSKLNSISLSYIEEILKVLEIFEEASKELEGEKYPTLHLVLPHINRLKSTCSVRESDLAFINHFKEKLNNLLDTIVFENLTVFHKLAVFLFPPTNKLIFFNENDKTLIRDECKTLMCSYFNDTTIQDHQTTPENPPTTRKTQLFTAFLQPAESSNEEDNINNEIIRYESTSVIYYDEFDVLQWWRLHQVQFPLLFKVANSLLAIPASSAASERLFSKARNLISEKRSAIGSNSFSVHQIMFLHYNMDMNILN